VKDRDQVSELELRSHRQVVLRDSGSHREVDSGWLQAQQRWTVSHFSSSIRIVRSGLAFAFLPQNWVKEELGSGLLARIPLAEDLRRSLPLYMLLADQQAAGPATRELYALLTDSLLEG
jgi:DNA-binding transcriptional LysR family regulator